MNKKIGVLTYNVKHRKTYDALSLLKARGYNNVTVYATPFHYSKKFKPLIEHRPKLNFEIPEPKELCKNLGYCFYENKFEEFEFEDDTIFLVCGAGILPDAFIEKNMVINAHPGYIPEARGLDALKWAIYENKTVGVTTHLLGEYVDAGEIIERKIVKIEPYDTFHALAERVYETEIGMLIDAIEKMEEEHVMVVPDEGSTVHKRMPHDIEKELLIKFENRKGLEEK